MPESSHHPTPRQRQILWTALTALAVTMLLGVSALVFYGFISFLSWCYPILLPIGLAVIVALVLDPIVGFVEKRGMKRENATLLVCIGAVVAFLLFWSFVVPSLASQTGAFFKSIPGMINKGVAKIDSSLSSAPETTPVLPVPDLPASNALESTNHFTIAQPLPAATTNPVETMPRATGERSDNRQLLQAWLKTNLPAIEESVQKNIANLVYSALGPVGQAFGFLLGFGFVPIYVYYFLADQESIARHWHEYVPLRRSKLRDEVVSVLAEINASLVSYFRGQIVVAACNGVLTWIGLWIIGIPYSLVLGIITGALSIVPFLGIICSIIPALLLAFITASDDTQWPKHWLHAYAGLESWTLQWLLPVLVLVVFAVVQMCESMFITPRVQSHSTGLHPITIILGILFWSLLLPGLLGPIVAVPLTCAAVVLLRRYVWLEKVKPPVNA